MLLFNPHIPLNRRKVLSARLLYLDSTRPHELSIARVGAKPALDNLKQNIFNITRQATLSSGNDVPLDDFVKSLAANLSGIHSTLREFLLNAEQGELLDSMLETFQQAADQLCCQSCSALRPQICNGSFDDDRIVTEKGDCISPLRRLFIIAYAAAGVYYSHFATIPPGFLLPKVTLSTGFSTVKPHDIPVDLFVNGATFFRDNGARHASQVQLISWVERFDWDTYMAILYALVHECVCHAFQSSLSIGNRVKPDEDDLFGEGWMDYVAWDVMEEVVGGRGPAGTLRKEIRYPTDSLTIGRSFYTVRGNYEPIDASSHAISCALGRAVADKMHYLLERLPIAMLPETHRSPRKAFLRLSFDLNLLRQPDDDLNGLISRIDEYLAPRELLDDLEQLETMKDIVCNYLKTNDVAAFVGDVLSL